MENKKEEVKKELTLNERKKLVQENFKKVTEEIGKLKGVAEQLKGQYALLEDLTKEETPKKEIKK